MLVDGFELCYHSQTEVSGNGGGRGERGLGGERGMEELRSMQQIYEEMEV